MQASIKAGTILIREGTLLPETLRLKSEPCAAGWTLIKELDGSELDRRIHEAGWTFFSLAGEISTTVFGMDEQKMARTAIERIVAKSEAKKFNSLEVVRVACGTSKRFFGVRHLTASAQSRHIQESFVLDQAPKNPLKPLALTAAV
jgi:hypothetical protein